MKESGERQDVLNEQNNGIDKKRSENKTQSTDSAFKSQLIEKLINKYKKKNLTPEEIKEMPKDNNAINLSDILVEIERISDEGITDILDDINNNNITIDIDEKAIKILNNKDIDSEKQKRIQSLLDGINQTINIDVDSISKLNSEQFENIKSRCTTDNKCKINRVYVNSGNDESAMDGYDVDTYTQIIRNADLMIEAALGGKNPKLLSEKEKFCKLYKYVVDNTTYDKHEVADHFHKSRNLENFFIKGRVEKDGKIYGKGKSICAGTADGLKNLCECLGLEAEYVQGKAKTSRGKEYHAWIKVKIDDEWYNADPTWDLSKTGLKPFSYCLKSDEDFKNHESPDVNYNPTYLRTSNSQNINLGDRTYHTTTKQSDNKTMYQYIDKDYIKEYKGSRAEAIRTYEDIPEEVLKASIEKKMPLSSGLNKKLTLRQRLANFLNKGKHLKNIPFVKSFISKHSTEIKKKNASTNAPNKTQPNSGIHRVDGNLNQAINNYEKSKQSEKSTQSKEQTNKGLEK